MSTIETQYQESNPFPAGSHITLHLTDGTSLSLQIIKPFLPFTKSQVYLVCPEPACNGLPSEIILKVFDPCYLDERIEHPKSRLPSHLWTLEAETEATRYRQDVADGKRKAEFTDYHPDHDAEPYLWEEYFYQALKESWESEVDALSCLKSLQGTVVPKFYASGNLVTPNNTRSIQPFAVLIEYVHSIRLADIEAGKHNITPAIFLPLLDAVKTFSDLGVFHADVKDHNILVSPPEAPTRAVLIDFGCAGVRREGDSDECWTFNVNFSSDERLLRLVLKEKGIILDTTLKEVRQ